MTVKVQIQDKNSKQLAKVTNRGQLIVAPLDFSEPVEQDMTLADTAYNFFKPITGKKFVITDILIRSTRGIPLNGAIIEIYEADTLTDTTISRLLRKTDLGRQQSSDISGLNWIVNEGVWINAKVDETGGVSVTIAGYYIDA